MQKSQSALAPALHSSTGQVRGWWLGNDKRWVWGAVFWESGEGTDRREVYEFRKGTLWPQRTVSPILNTIASTRAFSEAGNYYKGISQKPAVWKPQFKPPVYNYLALWLWSRYYIFLNHSFPIGETGLILVPTAELLWERHEIICMKYAV